MPGVFHEPRRFGRRSWRGALVFFSKRRKLYDVVDRYVAALNTRDARAMIGMLHPDCTFIDSGGYSTSGLEECARAVHAFLALDPGFRMHIESRTVRGNNVLLRGHMDADNPQFGNEKLWIMQVEEGKVRKLQAFGDGTVTPLVHRLYPEKSVLQADIA